jgi:hypothetical protein
MEGRGVAVSTAAVGVRLCEDDRGKMAAFLHDRMIIKVMGEVVTSPPCFW